MTSIAISKTGQQQPALQPAGFFESANSLRIELADGLTRELTQVSIGRLFVFGLLEDKQSWCFIRLSSVLGINFQTTEPTSSLVSWTRKSAGELITSLNLPAAANICFREHPGGKVGLTVLGVTKGLVVTDHYLLQCVPFPAISYLELCPAN
jgi:hypothetical protein